MPSANLTISPTLELPSPTTCLYLDCSTIMPNDVGIEHCRFYCLVDGHLPVSKKMEYKINSKGHVRFWDSIKADSIEFDVSNNCLLITLADSLHMNLLMTRGIGSFIKKMELLGWKYLKPRDLFKGLYDS